MHLQIDFLCCKFLLCNLHERTSVNNSALSSAQLNWQMVLLCHKAAENKNNNMLL